MFTIYANQIDLESSETLCYEFVFGILGTIENVVHKMLQTKLFLVQYL